MLRRADFKPKKTLESQQARCTSEESLLVEDAFAFQKYHLSFEGFFAEDRNGEKRLESRRSFPAKRSEHKSNDQKIVKNSFLMKNWEIRKKMKKGEKKFFSLS